MAAGMAEELERGGGGGVRSEVEESRDQAGRLVETGVRRSTGARHYYAGRLGERAHAGEHQTRHVHDSGVGAAINVGAGGREGGEESRALSRGGGGGGGDSGGGVAVVSRWSGRRWEI